MFQLGRLYLCMPTCANSHCALPGRQHTLWEPDATTSVHLQYALLSTTVHPQPRVSSGQFTGINLMSRNNFAWLLLETLLTSQVPDYCLVSLFHNFLCHYKIILYVFLFWLVYLTCSLSGSNIAYVVCNSLRTLFWFLYNYLLIVYLRFQYLLAYVCVCLIVGLGVRRSSPLCLFL